MIRPASLKFRSQKLLPHKFNKLPQDLRRRFDVCLRIRELQKKQLKHSIQLFHLFMFISMSYSYQFPYVRTRLSFPIPPVPRSSKQTLAVIHSLYQGDQLSPHPGCFYSIGKDFSCSPWLLHALTSFSSKGLSFLCTLGSSRTSL